MAEWRNGVKKPRNPKRRNDRKSREILKDGMTEMQSTNTNHCSYKLKLIAPWGNRSTFRSNITWTLSVNTAKASNISHRIRLGKVQQESKEGQDWVKPGLMFPGQFLVSSQYQSQLKNIVPRDIAGSLVVSIFVLKQNYKKASHTFLRVQIISGVNKTKRFSILIKMYSYVQFTYPLDIHLTLTQILFTIWKTILPTQAKMVIWF